MASKVVAAGIGIASGVGGCYYVENAIMLRKSAVLSSMGIPLPTERTVKKMSRLEVYKEKPVEVDDPVISAIDDMIVRGRAGWNRGVVSVRDAIVQIFTPPSS